MDFALKRLRGFGMKMKSFLFFFSLLIPIFLVAQTCPPPISTNKLSGEINTSFLQNKFAKSGDFKKKGQLTSDEQNQYKAIQKTLKDFEDGKVLVHPVLIHLVEKLIEFEKNGISVKVAGFDLDSEDIRDPEVSRSAKE
ncbi:MAG: hypothetical protein JWQ35_401 [Bacteriovoracaceae bacterium]|nr:hypothetical protein [Bacteriovoracaceae bacterium]